MEAEHKPGRLNYLFHRITNLMSSHLDKRIILVSDTLISFAATALIVLVLRIAALKGYYSPSGQNCQYLILLSSLVSSALMFMIVKAHHVIVRYTSIKDILKLAVALLGKVLLMAASLLCVDMWRKANVPVLAADFLLSFFLLIFCRIVVVFTYNRYLNHLRSAKKLQRVLVFGSDSRAAAIVLRLQNSTNYSVVGFLTDKITDRNMLISGKRVFYLQDSEVFRELVEKYDIDSLLFTDPNQVRAESERLVKYAIRTNVKVLVVPSLEETDKGEVASRIREVRVEDLLGRDEIRISMDRIIDNFSGKTVMVTGAAGSIGSELCRQLAGFGVKKLILFDNGETPLHNLRLNLEEKFPKLDFVPVIGDVRYKERLDFVFSTYKPQVVFHAAAYKHVPLMEENPCEAVMVNVRGSRQVADKCIEYGVEKMVMISTDKAVNPTNVMGCSKRLAEIYVQSLGKAIEEGKVQGRTKFVTTRFGNVLGSNGSVIPRFREQIAAGGPVTVTHPDITRFFMTIPEACRLVMEAATMSTGNDIFVFDMGRSVKIDTLARRMIELSGFTPDVDIKVQYTGLRPGEKLYEEVLADLEGTLSTSHDCIRIASIRPYDYSKVCDDLDVLARLASEVRIMEMVGKMKDVVPEYKSKNSVYEALDKKD